LAQINREEKIVVAKIVYYGPERSGKTANLEFLHEKYRHKVGAQDVMVKRSGNKPLFFDFLPLQVGKIGDFRLDIHFYTVPGANDFATTRRLVLKGVDGVVFVADSMKARRSSNLEAMKDLRDNLGAYERDISNMQYNKQDLASKGIPLLEVETLQSDLNRESTSPYFLSSCKTGKNIQETMKKAVMLTIASIKKGL
jgi:signal recognition particle receptor subunit beta